MTKIKMTNEMIANEIMTKEIINDIESIIK